jgi:branched-subunit amino acid aminotransferase/4-amino-4-deoxychorismate lyase
LPGWDPLHQPFDALPRSTLRIVDGQGVHWISLLTRLQLGAARLGWDISWLDREEPGIAAWISTVGMASCRAQLFPDAISIRLEALPEAFATYRVLTEIHPLGDIRSNGKATLKGLLGTWDMQARHHAREKAADDSLLLWPDGTLAETTIAAIGLQLNKRLVLPPLAGRVASIAEAVELPLWARIHGLAIERRPIRLEEVSAGQLWCMNALRGLWQAEVVQL